LIEQTAHDPGSIRERLKMAEEPMEALRSLASRRPAGGGLAAPEHRHLPLK